MATTNEPIPPLTEETSRPTSTEAKQIVVVHVEEPRELSKHHQVFLMVAFVVFVTFLGYKIVTGDREQEIKRDRCTTKEREVRLSFYLPIVNETCDKGLQRECTEAMLIQQLIDTYMADISYCDNEKAFKLAAIAYRTVDVLLRRSYASVAELHSNT